MTRKSLILLASPLLFLAAACDGDEEAKDSSAPDDSDSPADTDSDSPADSDSDSDTDTQALSPSITLTSPTGGQIQGTEATLTWTVENFTLDPNLEGTPVDGVGHVHIYDTSPGSDTPIYVAATSETSYTLTDLPSGPHTFEVRLSNIGHSELTGEGTFSSVVVEMLSASVLITEPADGITVDDSSVTLQLQFGDFSVSPEAGGANVDGQGHYHVYVDNNYYDFGTDPKEFTVSRLTPGDHKIEVFLANNDHNLIEPNVSSSINVTVSALARSVTLDNSYFTAGDFASATVPVGVSVQNFVLDESSLTSNVAIEGVGHYHIYVDGTYADLSADPLDYVQHMAPGPHILEVRLADGAHTEYARDWRRITLAADRKDVVIDSPPSGEIVSSDFSVNLHAENFTFFDFDPIITPNVDGEGHYHVYRDGGPSDGGAYVNAFYTPEFGMSGLSPGPHVIYVDLRNHDHSELNPPVFATFTVEVQ